jgi:hypothetical protein
VVGQDSSRSLPVFSLGVSLVAWQARDGDRQIDNPWEIILLEGTSGRPTTSRNVSSPTKPPTALIAHYSPELDIASVGGWNSDPGRFSMSSWEATYGDRGIPDEGSGHFALQAGGGLEFWVAQHDSRNQGIGRRPPRVWRRQEPAPRARAVRVESTTRPVSAPGFKS